MKNIYKLFAIIAIAGTAAALSSCSDEFLQRDSLSAVSSSTFWQNSQDALNGLAACYDGLQNNYVYNGGPWGCGPLNMDCMTDDGGHFNWSGWMPGYDYVNGTHSSSSSLGRNFWSAYYEVIKRCNALLANIDRCGLDAATLAQYKAEAITIRAFMYHNLTSTFQDVPYITEPLTIETAYVSKTDKATIVNNLITDLTAAADVLPVQAPALGRLTKGAALAILGRVYLYNKKWSEAASTYEKIIGLGCYSLFNDYTTLFCADNEGCNEIVFSVRYTGPGQSEGGVFNAHWNTPLEALNGTIDLADAYYKLDGTPYTDKDDVGEWKDDGTIDINKPNPARYENRDPRLKTTLWVPGMSWRNKSIETGDTYGGAAAAYSTIYVNKYFDSFDTSNSWDGGDDFYVIRYAEVLLSLAEAYVEQGTNLDKAIQLVDQVRARVGMPSVEQVEKATSQSDLREIVRHERRVELAFEGIRLYDLYRWHLLEEEVAKINAEKAKYGFWYEDRFYRGEKEYVWPIPQVELDANENLEQHDLLK